jgi:hypothetical protein
MGLDEALRIPGAYAVALIAADGPALTWWGHSPTDQESQAAAGVGRAAADLVRLSTDDALDDVLITSAQAFHVLRLVPGEGGAEQVAHLMLRRMGANLAMARHDFRRLTTTYAKAESAPAQTEPDSAATKSDPAVTEPDSVEPEPQPQPQPQPQAENAVLPRRSPNQKNLPPATATANATPAAWLDLLGQPYLNDETVLERVLGSLKHL